MFLYVLNKLFLKPDGGYKVILILFCKIGIENDSDGIDVNHNLKSLCIPSFNPSTINYSSGIQLIDKWQFCNKTQYPLEVDNSTNTLAFLP